MEKEEYNILYNIEDNYWWYIGLRKLVFSFIDKFNSEKNGLKILDAGCGTGAGLENCKTNKAYGLDFSEEAIRFCRRRRLDNLVRGSVCNVPFKNSSFDIVISLDVLYHTGVEDDVKTLQEFYKVLNTGGILLLNLPAYDFLRGKHDKAVHTRHRYTINDLKGKIEVAGFSIIRITYRNTILFPFAAIKRMIERIIIMDAEKVKSDLKPLPDLLNKLFIGFLNLENKLIISGVNFPFGLSLFCVAEKKR